MNWRSNSASGFHPRTVSRYRQRGPLPQPHPRQRCLTFVRNHAKAIVACDFLVVVTARFRLLPTADWTLQQFREAPAGDHSYRFVIHDRDSIFLRGTGRGRDRHERAGAADSGAGAKGKLRMLALRRHVAPGVSGLPHPLS
jgi:hypothetical protein